ncbi:hypothetical protein D6858_08165 [Tsuneonella suprasediminis]|uniref:Amidohydrolase-related domain-containing protein n=2 Tax=Tsuneonella suprasediminis TaxID=2306996 RepID=A0A419R1S5_9SPHN|nr:hypothetical protein D6858_08165 [Tsuneonella suprasediminis]
MMKACVGLSIRSVRRTLAMCIAGGASLAMPVAYAADDREPTYVIDRVSVIDVTAAGQNAAINSDRRVLIRAGRIATVGDLTLPIPEGAVTIDGTGKYLVPGFWDMHAHLPAERAYQTTVLNLMLANGVTAFRDMGTDLSLPELKHMKAELAGGKLDAPQLLASPLLVVSGREGRQSAVATDDAHFEVETAREAENLVDFVRNRHIDFIKIYDSVPRDAYFGLMRRAARLGVETGGHVPMQISVREAVAAGQRTVDHARELPIACAPGVAEELQTYYLDQPEARFVGRWKNPAFAKLVGRTVDEYDPAACALLFKEMVAAGTYYVPTHGTRRFDALAWVPEFRDDPKLAYIPTEGRAEWREEAERYGILPWSVRSDLVRFYFHGLRLTGDAYRAGVNILVGTDTPDSYIIPGFSYQLEMNQLQEAGLPPLAILKAATIEAARFMKREGDYGTIAPGKVADIVMLSANPLTDIGNASHIDAVFRAGRYLNRTALDGLLDEARENADDNND